MAAVNANGCGAAKSGAPVSDKSAAIDRQDPLTCQGCHAGHYQSWSLSMHAYAGDDPIFAAMNARGQRETGGALGDFCIRCHAPLAVARGASTDGLNLGDLPAALRGVTCVVCHEVTDTGTASLAAADGSVMHGPIVDPVANPAHASLYSTSHDRQRAESATFCGGCHAVTTLHGLEVERTIDEWRTTQYAQPTTLRTCGRCHMPETIGVAAEVAGVPERPIHEHAMAGVDLGAGSTAQRQVVAKTLDPAIAARLCVIPASAGVSVSATLENALVGHAWPSGATQDRRAWLELVAYAGGMVVYSSGSVGDDEAVTASASPPLLLLREQLYDEGDQPTLFMWSALTAQSTLLAPATGDPAQSTRTATIQLDGSVDRVTARVRVRAIDHDVLDALVASGDLPASKATGLATLTVGATQLEWTSDRGAACLP
jgi:Cytochrome c554 and c-prime